MALRYEAWTTPWDPGGFHRKVSMMPVIEGSGRGSVGFLSLGNDGSADISLANFDRLGDLVSETKSSLITVYDSQPNGTNTIIDEWILDRVPQRLAEAREVSLAGPSLLKEALDKALVYAFDYPMSPSVTRDWIWGKNEDSDNTGLIRNGDFEDVPLPNGGFEDGNAGYWQGTESDGDIIGRGAISAINSPVDARTGSWYGLVNPLAQGGGARRSIGGLVPGNLYTITGWINETSGSGDRLRAGVIGASTATHTNAYKQADIWWAEIGNASQGNGSSNGNWQSITLTFRPETDHIELVVIYDDVNDRTFRIDDWAISGDNVGLEPWIPFTMRQSDLNVARHSTAQAHNGAGSVQMQGVDRPFYDAFGRIGYGTFGIKQNVRMVPGRLYTMTAWVRHNGTGSNGANEYFRIILARNTPKGNVQRTLTGDFIPGPGSYHMAARNELVPANTWTKIQMTVYADVSDLSAEVRYAGTLARTDVGNFTSPTFWIDDVSIHEGLPATTIGDIWQRLLDDCAVSHINDTRGTVLDWIDYSSFDATNDSNGTPWNEDIPFLARWGSTMGHVLDDTFNRGYEAELVRKATPSGGKTHEFHLYNSGGRDDTPEVGINTAQPNLGGETLFRSPAYTATLVATPDGAFSEDSDAGSLANFGRLETFLMDSEASGPISRQLLSNNLLNYEQANRRAVRFELIEAPGTPRPFVDYRPGDTISMTQPPGLPKEQRRVQRIDYVNLQPTQYVVVGSRIVEGEAAAFDLIERLWRRLNRPGKTNDPELGVGGEGGKGGAPTIVIAASDASDISKFKADFECSGVNDHVVIQGVIDSLITHTGARILLTEGQFNIAFAGTRHCLTTDNPITIEGMGSESTVINITDSFSGADWERFALYLRGPDSYVKGLTVQGGNGVSGKTNGIYAERANSHIRDVLFATDGVGLRFTDGFCSVEFCLFHTTLDMGVEAFGDHSKIIGNHFRVSSDGVVLSNSVTGFMVVSNNTFELVGGSAITSDVFDGIHHSVILGNVIRRAGQHGIILNDSSKNIIQDNLILEVGATNDTHDGIILTGDSNNNLIKGNKVLSRVASPRTRYGINIADAACDDNALIHNDLRPSSEFGSGDINDAGTNTIFHGNINDGGAGGEGAVQSSKAVFSQAGVLSTGSGAFKLPFTLDAEIISVLLAVGTSPTGANLIVDVNKNGTTVFTTQANRPTVPDGDANGVGAEAVPDVTAISEGDYLTVDIDQIGSSVAGEDLTVVVEWRPT